MLYRQNGLLSLTLIYNTLAYPLDTESLLSKQLPILFSKVPKQNDIMLVTHVGPVDVSTTDVNKYPNDLKERISGGR